MLFALNGLITHQEAERIGLLVNGIEYEIFVPINLTFSPNQSLRIFIHHYLRENEERLYGFSTLDDRELFIFLLNIKGVGPQLALSILSHLDWQKLQVICEKQDSKQLQKIPRIGKVTAEMLIFELNRRKKNWTKGGKAKLEVDQEQAKAVQVLQRLGYGEAEILAILNSSEKEEKMSGNSAEYWIKFFLRRI